MSSIALKSSKRATTMVINERLRFERILCPLDLSPDSGEALRYAIALANSFAAKLLVCHCTGSSTAPVRDAGEITRHLEASIGRYLRLPGAPEFDSETIVVNGDPSMA